MCTCTTVPSQDVQRRVTQMTSNMSRYNFFAAWYKMNTCTVLVLAKDVCVILHHLVHFMGCWVHVNLLMLSDMQALHTQRTLIDLSLTIDRTKLGLLWMFDERQCRNNKTISPQSFQNEESYSSDLLKMMKTYFLLLRDISRKTKILPNLRGSRLSVPNFIAIRPNIPLDYLH